MGAECRLLIMSLFIQAASIYLESIHDSNSVVYDVERLQTNLSVSLHHQQFSNNFTTNARFLLHLRCRFVYADVGYRQTLPSTLAAHSTY